MVTVGVMFLLFTPVVWMAAAWSGDKPTKHGVILFVRTEYWWPILLVFFVGVLLIILGRSELS